MSDDAIADELQELKYQIDPLEKVQLLTYRRPRRIKVEWIVKQENTMVTRASGSQSTKTVPKAGQNKPVSGGKAGAGDARGTAKLPNISKTSAKTTR